ncbi:inactive peptidyl-prolyl cis-trans isomerase FKBP6-like [Argonauta hians]
MNQFNLQDLTSDSGMLFEVDKDDNIYPSEDSISNDGFKLVYSRKELDKLTCVSFDQLLSEMTDISDGQQGVHKTVKHPGYGPQITEGMVVEVHYAGFFEYGDEPFDSSWLREETMKYRVGSGRAIPGWELSLLTMKKGEISWFLVQPQFGFQQNGCPPRIPRHAAALFEIEVVSVSEHLSPEDFFLMSEEEKSAVTFDMICGVVEKHKMEGYSFFKLSNYNKAVHKYKKCLNLLEVSHLKNDHDEELYLQYMTAIQLNLALCCLKMSHFARAVTYCRNVLNRDHSNAKALFRLGQALHQLGDFSESLRHLEKARKQLPTDAVILREIHTVKSDRDKFQLVESKLCRKMFSALSVDQPIVYQQSKKTEPKEAVTEEFRTNTEQYIREFQQDTSQSQCPMPHFRLSEAEMEFLVKTIDDSNLRILQTGTGESSRLTIVKPDLVSPGDGQTFLD